MNCPEIDSFIVKFRNLWKLGFDAHLNLESHAGQAWVGLYVRLGHGPHPAQQHQHQHFQSPLNVRTRDGPSRQRRRARRAAARAEQVDTVEQTKQDDPVIVAEVAEEAEKAEDTHGKAADNVVLEEEANKVTGKVNGSIAFETKEQTDATVNNPEEISDEVCPDSAYLAEHAEENVTFTFMSDYGEEDILDSFEEIFPGITADLQSRVRVERLSADHFCTVMLHPVSARTFAWPAMDTVNTEVFRDIRRITK